MKLFDLHCDTLTEIRKKRETLEENSCQVSLSLARSVFEEYIQVMAIYSDNSLDGEENYRLFWETLDYAGPMLRGEGFTPILAVEGSRLLCGKLDRLEKLRDAGVKILTLVWGGECCVGGAHDTSVGLTPFGREVVEGCFDLGIVPDLSHASDRLFEEVVSLAEERKAPVIASHSCSRALFPHSRNLTDEMAKKIARLGGVIGVNLFPHHLGGGTLETVCRHILHFASLVGENGVCLGGDLDGVSALPDGIRTVADLPHLHGELSHYSHSADFADRVFYSNARTFAKDSIFG